MGNIINIMDRLNTAPIKNNIIGEGDTAVNSPNPNNVINIDEYMSFEEHDDNAATDQLKDLIYELMTPNGVFKISGDGKWAYYNEIALKIKPENIQELQIFSETALALIHIIDEENGTDGCQLVDKAHCLLLIYYILVPYMFEFYNKLNPIISIINLMASSTASGIDNHTNAINNLSEQNDKTSLLLRLLMEEMPETVVEKVYNKYNTLMGSTNIDETK